MKEVGVQESLKFTSPGSQEDSEIFEFQSVETTLDNI